MLMKEKPQNGIPGLKHWRYDLVAGLQVALVYLPFSLGIAIASGAPPVAGLISAISRRATRCCWWRSASPAWCRSC